MTLSRPVRNRLTSVWHSHHRMTFNPHMVRRMTLTRQDRERLTLCACGSFATQCTGTPKGCSTRDLHIYIGRNSPTPIFSFYCALVPRRHAHPGWAVVTDLEPATPDSGTAQLSRKRGTEHSEASMGTLAANIATVTFVIKLFHLVPPNLNSTMV